MARPVRAHRGAFIGVAIAAALAGCTAGSDASGGDRAGGVRTAGVAAQPSSVGQVESGPLTWGPIERIGGGGYTPAAVYTPDGTAMVIWNGPRGLRSRQALPGEPWQSPQRMPGRARFGSIVGAMSDDAGTVTLVWWTERSRRYQVLAARHRAGGSWTRPRLLGSGPAEYDSLASVPVMAVGSTGAAIVAWVESEGKRVRAVYRSAPGGWSKPATLSRSGWSYSRAVTVDTRGLATVGYVGKRGHLRLFQRSGPAWKEPVVLAPRPRGSRFDIDAGRRGEVVIVWKTRATGTRVGRFTRGAWEAGRVAGPSRFDELSVDAAADGSATFLWWRGFARPGEIRVRQQASDGALGPSTVIAHRGMSTGETLVSNRRGDALFAWVTHAAKDYFLGEVYASYQSHGETTWSEPFNAAEGDAAEVSAGQSADIGPDGSVLIAWYGYDPDATLARRATPN